jgi:hypothetical protein
MTTIALLLLTWLTGTANATPWSFENFKLNCPPTCGHILNVDVEIEPGWLVEQDKLVGGLRSLLVTVRLTEGEISATVNGVLLSRENLIRQDGDVSVYRVPASVRDQVVVSVASIGREEQAGYTIDVDGSSDKAP